MSIGTAIYDRLTGHAGTTALISTRCYRSRMPDKPTLPNVVFHRVSSSEQQGSSDLRDTRYQMNCWASTSEGAEALATQVRTALEEWAGDATTVKMCRVVNEIDDYEDDAELYRVIMDAIFTIFE